MDIEERQQLRKKVLDFLEAHGIAYELYELINDMNLTDADPKELFENGHRVKYYLDTDLLGEITKEHRDAAVL